MSGPSADQLLMISMMTIYLVSSIQGRGGHEHFRLPCSRGLGKQICYKVDCKKNKSIIAIDRIHPILCLYYIITLSQMSGGYEYNLTTESEFEQMKQKYQDLMEQNYGLKKTLEDLLKINNELSDTIEEFNNSDWANFQSARNGSGSGSGKGDNRAGVQHQECQKLIQGLEQEVEYFKGVATGKLDGEDNVEVLNALEGLIDSFKQAQKYYEDELSVYCEQIDNMKAQWEGKIFKIEQSYFQKTRVLEELIKQLKKKQEIVSIIEKKMAEESGKPSRKLLKKNSEIDTSSERKVGTNHLARQVENSSNATKEKDKEKSQQIISNKQLEDLRVREKKLNDQLREKDKTIAVYTQLLGKLRKKLAEKL